MRTRTKNILTFGYIILCLVSFVIYLMAHQWLTATWPLCTALWVFLLWQSDRQYKQLKAITDEAIALSKRLQARGDALYAVLCELGPEIPPGISN
jgi:hypothetical protein